MYFQVIGKKANWHLHSNKKLVTPSTTRYLQNCRFWWACQNRGWSAHGLREDWLCCRVGSDSLDSQARELCTNFSAWFSCQIHLESGKLWTLRNQTNYDLISLQLSNQPDKMISAYRDPMTEELSLWVKTALPQNFWLQNALYYEAERPILLISRSPASCTRFETNVEMFN